MTIIAIMTYIHRHVYTCIGGLVIKYRCYDLSSKLYYKLRGYGADMTTNYGMD